MTREPKLEILIRIADFYGVTLDYLVGRSEKDNGRANALPFLHI